MMQKFSKDSIEAAYCFFHQKWNVYAGKSSETQRDDIEYAISSYVDAMDKDLYAYLCDGNNAYLREHKEFPQDIVDALRKLSSLSEEG